MMVSLGHSASHILFETTLYVQGLMRVRKSCDMNSSSMHGYM